MNGCRSPPIALAAGVLAPNNAAAASAPAIERLVPEDIATPSSARDRPLKLEHGRKPQAAGLGGMAVEVADPGSRLAGEPRSVEVVYVVARAVEEVVRLDAEADVLGYRVPDLRVHDRRRPGSLRAIFDQRPRPEVAEPQSAGPRAGGVGQACGGGAAR